MAKGMKRRAVVSEARKKLFGNLTLHSTKYYANCMGALV